VHPDDVAGDGLVRGGIALVEDDEEEATIKYAESILEKLPESRRDG
jgi:hypothetical protein